MASSSLNIGPGGGTNALERLFCSYPVATAILGRLDFAELLRLADALTFRGDTLELVYRHAARAHLFRPIPAAAGSDQRCTLRHLLAAEHGSYSEWGLCARDLCFEGTAVRRTARYGRELAAMRDCITEALVAAIATSRETAHRIHGLVAQSHAPLEEHSFGFGHVPCRKDFSDGPDAQTLGLVRVYTDRPGLMRKFAAKAGPLRELTRVARARLEERVAERFAREDDGGDGEDAELQLEFVVTTDRHRGEPAVSGCVARIRRADTRASYTIRLCAHHDRPFSPRNVSFVPYARHNVSTRHRFSFVPVATRLYGPTGAPWPGAGEPIRTAVVNYNPAALTNEQAERLVFAFLAEMRRYGEEEEDEIGKPLYHYYTMIRAETRDRLESQLHRTYVVRRDTTSLPDAPTRCISLHYPPTIVNMYPTVLKESAAGLF